MWFCGDADTSATPNLSTNAPRPGGVGVFTDGRSTNAPRPGGVGVQVSKEVRSSKVGNKVPTNAHRPGVIGVQAFFQKPHSRIVAKEASTNDHGRSHLCATPG